MLVVKKFGGTSVANKERIFNVAKRCIEDYQKGNDVVVVLSAMGKQTDVLLDMANDINPKASKRELDMLLTTGEQTSVALMAMAMQSLNVPAISLNAFQVAMHADACEIYTDVDGVYTADPRIVKDAKKLDEITYDEMLELASLGAGVLHNRSVEMAKKYGVQLVVRSSLNTSEGTVVKEEVKMEKMLVSGVACDKNVARIAVVGLEDQPGVAFKLFRHLANHNVNVDMILQSIGRDNTKDISFTVTGDMADIAVETVERHRSGSLKCQEVKVKKDVAKVSIVGAGMQSNPGVAARMFEALYSANVNIQQISTSEIRVTVLIDREDTDRAMNAVHNEFDF